MTGITNHSSFGNFDAASPKLAVTALVTSHNRRTQTVSCLASFFAQQISSLTTLTAVVVDDGSTDGTSNALRRFDDNLRIIEGRGDLFWAKAMALAEREALSQPPNHLLWLNDDVVLDPDALERLLEVSKTRPTASIVVGALRDPETAALTYSGVRRRDRHPLSFDLVAPLDYPAEVETFNGNVALVPVSVAQQLGGIDGSFAHAAADFDYGLRARRLGIHCLLAPGAVGTCRRGPASAKWLDDRLSRRDRVAALLGPKGIPPRSTARYLRRHGGRAWLAYWAGSYAKAGLTVALTPTHSRRMKSIR
jgi:GT2 family glycosyltransferase